MIVHPLAIGALTQKPSFLQPDTESASSIHFRLKGAVFRRPQTELHVLAFFGATGFLDNRTGTLRGEPGRKFSAEQFAALFSLNPMSSWFGLRPSKFGHPAQQIPRKYEPNHRDASQR